MEQRLQVLPEEIQVVTIDSPIFRRIRNEVLLGKRHGMWFPKNVKISPGPAFFYSLRQGRFIEVYVEKVEQGNRQLVCWREVVFQINNVEA